MDIKYPKFVGKFARQFISSLLKKKAALRMPLSRVPGHPWIVHELSTKVGKPKPKAFPDYRTAGQSRPSSKMLSSSRVSGKR